MAKPNPSTASIFTSVQTNMGTLTWRLALLVGALVLIGCQGQTFQYSRGWTNGKRGYAGPPMVAGNSGSAGQGQLFDVDSTGSVEDSAVSPAGAAAASAAFRVVNPDGSQKLRFRDREYYQLARKLSSGNNKKSPVWILRTDQGAGPENSVDI